MFTILICDIFAVVILLEDVKQHPDHDLNHVALSQTYKTDKGDTNQHEAKPKHIICMS